MQLYRTKDSRAIIEDGGHYYSAGSTCWDALVTRDDLGDFLCGVLATARKVERLSELLRPIGSQEVWAAGVTYYRSRRAVSGDFSEESPVRVGEMA